MHYVEAYKVSGKHVLSVFDQPDLSVIDKLRWIGTIASDCDVNGLPVCRTRHFIQRVQPCEIGVNSVIVINIEARDSPRFYLFFMFILQ